MIVKGLLLVGSVVAFGALTLFAAILAVVQRSQKAALQKWLTIAGVSFVVSIGLAWYTVYRTVETVVEHSDAIAEKIADGADQAATHAKEGLSEAMVDNRTWLLEPDTNAIVAQLHAWAPDSIRDSIPATHYTYFGFLDSWRFPLVYPYAIDCIDVFEKGWVANESAVKRHIHDGGGSIWVNMPAFSTFQFDANYFLAQHPQRVADTITTYSLFYFHTEESETFTSETQLFERARALNYTGPDTLMTIPNYNILF